jgi:hypothetical protein
MSIISAGTSNTTSLVYTGDTTGAMVFQTNGTTEAMRITSGGNVGIGTTSPIAKLDVRGSGAYFYDNSTTDFQLTVGSSISTIGTTTATPLAFKTNVTERMRIDSSGNVGIGISSPTAKLHVYGDSNNQFKVESSGAEANFTLAGTSYGQINNDVGDWYLTNGSASGAMIFRAGSSAERMRILSDGSILLGTSTQGGATGISFSNASDSAAYGKSMYMNSPYNGTRNAITFAYNSAGGVGQIVTGTNSVSYQSGSDYRLKENIAPMTGALATVALLKPVTFKWKSDSSDGQGFIAHELQAVVPDCVTGEKDAVDADNKPVYQGVDTSFLVATLTAAIQELNAKVDAQAAEIAALKGNN